MADNKPIQEAKDGKKLAYGIGENATETSIGNWKCYLQNCTVQEEGDVKTYKDNIGQTCAMVIPETWQTLQCDGLIFAGASGSMPKKGEAVDNLPDIKGMRTKGNGKWRLESISVQWANEDVAKVSMSIRLYPF